MKKSELKTDRFFVADLLKQIIPSYLLALIVMSLYVVIMQYVDHQVNYTAMFVVAFAILKTFYFTFFTFKQVNISVKRCHYFTQYLWTFGLLVFLIIFSYSTDYACLYFTDSQGFYGIKYSQERNFLALLFEFFYFSIVTFASIGYGDIVPVSLPAKLLVLLEIGQSFVLVVFGLSNINNIHTLRNNGA
ncbi:MAG: ion transporter [Verrucomicrobia bacterium]|nr:ion transporter [Verrucomicrobiota bacterium]|tara:strand:- start:1690 stop:2256 length:567 start_codon:yes stop_codon:yes gene_type:complete